MMQVIGHFSPAKKIIRLFGIVNTVAGFTLATHGAMGLLPDR